MKMFLKLLFGGIFVFMVVMTIRTGLTISLSAAWPSYAANPWAMATLYDAYFGFVTFYAWVFYKERSVWARAFVVSAHHGAGQHRYVVLCSRSTFPAQA